MDPLDGEITRVTIEDVKEGGGGGGDRLYQCNFFDTEIVHKIAQALLAGFASACVDNTMGDLLRTPSSVAIDMRREMIDYLTQRSESFVAECIVLDGVHESEMVDHPYDIVSDFIDDFSSSKRNFFSRVSDWLLSERREDKIDDFVQEIETTGFWPTERRENIARSLIKNVDFKNKLNCSMKFKSAEELDQHVLNCSFRNLNCSNEGCDARFSASQIEHHDSLCPFKVIPCEQECSASIMRRHMDRHCVTVCPMKVVNCPFYPVGCRSSVPLCKIEEHRLENLHSHLIFVLQVIHREASLDDLNPRANQLENSTFLGQLEEAKDARSLTIVIKELESKLELPEVHDGKQNV